MTLYFWYIETCCYSTFQYVCARSGASTLRRPGTRRLHLVREHGVALLWDPGIRQGSSQRHFLGARFWLIQHLSNIWQRWVHNTTQHSVLAVLIWFHGWIEDSGKRIGDRLWWLFGEAVDYVGLLRTLVFAHDLPLSINKYFVFRLWNN